MNTRKETENLIEQTDMETDEIPEIKTADDNEQTEAEAQAADETKTEGNNGIDQIAQLQKQVDENSRQFLRVQADFDNFRRRTRLEKEELYKYASMNLIEQLLPIVDNFERALSSSKETQNFEALVKGIEMISSQLNQVLESEGLQSIDALDKPFNPEFHQAIAQVDSDEHDEGMVVEVVQRGYIMKEKILRPSMVKVSK